jgi:hypothetical protein
MFSHLQQVSEDRGHHQVSTIKILRENYLYINIKPLLRRKFQPFTKKSLGVYKIVKF